jgi:putative transcriptional regulator
MKTKRRLPERRVFTELMSGVDAMRSHRGGRLTLRTHHVEPLDFPRLPPDVVRQTREALHMSRQVFAFKLGVNPRTLERWEQGRSKPNGQAAALIWLVRKYPDTLERLESVATPD